MQTDTTDTRRFLFLQGPHGPFFSQLGRALRRAGAETWRVGFNGGDRRFWKPRDRFITFGGTVDDWPARFQDILSRHRITDIVLYGDTRPVHAIAVRIARTRGVTVHVFEEGYLRPHWVTYERGGSNGHSRLMTTSVAEMSRALAPIDPDLPDAPARWGDMRRHIYYGALYHFHVLFRNGDFPGFRPHRDLSVWQEFLLYAKRLCLLPATFLERAIASFRIRHGGFPFHLALLQLEHDSSFREHSPFATMADFAETVITEFAAGAPRHHHLVFKAHPLEDGRVPLRRVIARLGAAHGISDRIHYVPGGRLADLLNQTRSVVTVNSTAAQQALWRGLPLRAFGEAVYSKPEFVSNQPLAEFFAKPASPDSRAYRVYRHYLLETSQVSGGFYAASGRRRLLREIIDKMLSPDDPYDALVNKTTVRTPPLRVVK